MNQTSNRLSWRTDSPAGYSAVCVAAGSLSIEAVYRRREFVLLPYPKGQGVG